MIENIAKENTRSGEHVSAHVIVLGSVLFSESHKIVHMLSSDFGRISAVARGAANSRKRFAGSLEAFTHSVAHLKIPKDQRNSESPLWQLESMDFKNSFTHLKQSYDWLETALFVTSLVKDNTPEAATDAILFRALGRFLRDSSKASTNVALASWSRLYFWTFFAQHLGFGNFMRDVSHKFFKDSEKLKFYFLNLHVQAEPDFGHFFTELSAEPVEKLSPEDEIFIYKKWLEMSGLHWAHFEKWYALKK